jgi:hypothetical protein
MYRIFAQLDDGQFLFVARRDELDVAIELIDGLNAYWPREYVVRDSQGNDVDVAKYTATEPEREAASSMS